MKNQRIALVKFPVKTVFVFLFCFVLVTFGCRQKADIQPTGDTSIQEKPQPVSDLKEGQELKKDLGQTTIHLDGEFYHYIDVFEYADGTVKLSVINLTLEQHNALLAVYKEFVNAVKDGDWKKKMDSQPIGAKEFYGANGGFGVRDVCEKSELSNKAKQIRIDVLGSGDESALPPLWGKDLAEYISEG